MSDILKAGIGIGVILAAIITLGFFKPAHADELFTKEALSPVYKIISGQRTCSATSVKVKGIPDEVNTFLTAKHCIDPANPRGKLIVETVTESSESTQYYDFTVALVSKGSDLAGITVTDTNLHTNKAIIADALKAQEGDEVLSIGYPFGASRVVSEGFLGQKERIMHPNGELKLMQRASTLVDSGMSGGPLYQKTATGYEIIGVASTKSQGNNFMNHFVTLADIKAFIEKGE
ncbi:putative trypsin-like peptidase protein [Rhizobium phage RHph_I3_11]|nr:putative trypsin-like peptidase protein [Rhizobium phage RHph_I3_11]